MCSLIVWEFRSILWMTLNVPDVQNLPEDNVLNNMLTTCSVLNTDSHRGKETDNLNHEAINKPVKG